MNKCVLTIIRDVYAEFTAMAWMSEFPTFDGISENFGIDLLNFSHIYD